MFGMWDVRDVSCSGCGMFRMWDVKDVWCFGCGIFKMWHVRDVGYSRCRMLGIWDIRNVGCWFTNCPCLTPTKVLFLENIFGKDKLFLRSLEKNSASQLPLFFLFFPPLFRNNGEFGAKTYFTDLQTADATPFFVVIYKKIFLVYSFSEQVTVNSPEIICKSLKLSEQIAPAIVLHFGQVFACCRLINKNVLEWFLLILCKEHTLRRYTNLFLVGISLTVFLIKKRRLTDAQYWTATLSNWQKKPPEVFSKKSCSQKFPNIHRKTPVLESLFQKVADLQDCNFIKKRLQHRYLSVPKFWWWSGLSLSKPSWLSNITKITVAFKSQL